MTDLAAIALTLLVIAAICLLEVALWPRRRVVLALAVSANAITYVILWSHPGLGAVLVGMTAAAHLVRVSDAVASFPAEEGRLRFLLFQQWLIRHPTRERRLECDAPAGQRVALGVGLHAAAFSLMWVGAQARLWTWAPYLDDWLMAVELGCYYLGVTELVTPVARWWGLDELVLGFEGLRRDFLGSPSLRTFWSARWNQPMSNVLRRGFFVPAGGGRRPVRATLLVFLVSGLIHAVPLLMAGTDRLLWTFVAVGATGFFVLHGVAAILEGALTRAPRGGGLGRVVLYGTFALTVPLYPAPLFCLFGIHGRPVDALTPVVIARSLGLL